MAGGGLPEVVARLVVPERGLNQRNHPRLGKCVAGVCEFDGPPEEGVGKSVGRLFKGGAALHLRRRKISRPAGKRTDKSEDRAPRFSREAPLRIRLL